MPCSQTEGLPAEINQSSCYSATVSHMHQVRSLLTDPIPKFTSFLGSVREGTQQDQGEQLGKQANSLPGAQVNSDSVG